MMNEIFDKFNNPIDLREYQDVEGNIVIDFPIFDRNGNLIEIETQNDSEKYYYF